MTRLARSCALVAALWLGHATAGFAQDGGLELVRPGGDGRETPAITIKVPALTTELRLRNTGVDGAPALRLVLRDHLLRVADGKTVSATWQRIDVTDASVDAGRVEPGEEATFTLSATLAEPGTYETEIDAVPVVAAGSQALPSKRLRVVVLRAAVELPADFIVEPKPAAMSWTGWPWPGAQAILLTVRNSATEPVDFTGPVITSFARRATDDSQSAVAATGLPIIDSSQCATPLPAGSSCAVKLTVGAGLSPGLYAIGIGIGGVGGRFDETEQVIKVRAAAFWAFLVIILGAACGWYIRVWRESGRRAVLGLISASRLHEKLERLAPGVTDDADLARLSAAAADGIAATEEMVRSGENGDTRLAALGAYVDNIAAAVEIRRHLVMLSPAGRQALDPRWRALIATFTIDATQETQKSLRDRLTGLAADIGAWPSVEAGAKGVQMLSVTLAALDERSNGAQRTATLAILQRLDDAVKIALKPFGAHDIAPGDSVAKRRDDLAAALSQAQGDALQLATQSAAALETTATALNARPLLAKPEHAAIRQEIEALQSAARGAAEAIKASPTADQSASTVATHIKGLEALWAKLAELELRVASAGEAEGTVEATAQATVLPTLAGVEIKGLSATFDPPLDILLPRPGTSLIAMQRQRVRHELATNGAILVITGLGGVVALWDGNPTWGSMSDILIALLSGAAARVVVGEVTST